MGVLNLAHCRGGSQEQMRQCKLAITYLATSIVQLTRFSVPLHLRPQVTPVTSSRDVQLLPPAASVRKGILQRTPATPTRRLAAHTVLLMSHLDGTIILSIDAP